MIEMFLGALLALEMISKLCRALLREMSASAFSPKYSGLSSLKPFSSAPCASTLSSFENLTVAPLAGSKTTGLVALFPLVSGSEVSV